MKNIRKNIFGWLLVGFALSVSSLSFCNNIFNAIFNAISIYDAIEKDDIDTLEKIINSKDENGNNFDINKHYDSPEYCYIYDTTYLSCACKHGKLEIVKLFLENGASVDAKSMGIAEKNDIENKPYAKDILNLLQEKLDKQLRSLNKIELNNQNENGETLVLKACKYNSFTMLQKLLDMGAEESINKAEAYNDKNTPLSYACDFFSRETFSSLSKNKNMVELLLKKGAKKSINIPTNDGFTPLHLACTCNRGDNSDIIELLLNNGAQDSVNIVTTGKTDYTPLSLVCEMRSISKNQKVSNLLLKYCSKETINKRHEHSNGQTPLLIALQNYNLDMVEILLKNADAQDSINIADDYNQTPLSFAIANLGNGGYYQGEDLVRLSDITKLLLQHSTKETINKQNNENGWTALIYACRNDDLNMVKLLLEKGAKDSINCETDHQMTAILFAHCNLDITKLLLENGAIINDEILEYAREDSINNIPNAKEVLKLLKLVDNFDKETRLYKKFEFIDDEKDESIKKLFINRLSNKFKVEYKGKNICFSVNINKKNVMRPNCGKYLDLKTNTKYTNKIEAKNDECEDIEMTENNNNRPIIIEEQIIGKKRKRTDNEEKKQDNQKSDNLNYNQSIFEPKNFEPKNKRSKDN